MSRFSIRPASGASEIEAARRLMRAYARWLRLDLGFQNFEDELARLPGVYTPPSGQLWLAWRDDGAALGCIAVKPLAAAVCEMKRLWVEPAGQGLGVGRALAEAAIAFARAAGYREMKLDTLRERMQPAVSLYRSLGFRDTAPYVHNPEPDVVYLALQLQE